MSKRSVYIETVGCKLNQYESRALAECFERKNWTVSSVLEEADCVVVNTCSVTNRADSKSRAVMRKARRLGKRVVATGCYATTDSDELHTSDMADLIVKNDSKFRIPDLLEKSLETDGKIPPPDPRDEFPVVHRFERTRAYVKIQDGCDKFCSYCKIPHARGRSRSLSPSVALEYIRSLLDTGYREIVLTGVNISDYRFNDHRLYDLVRDALALDGNFRLRLSSLQPDEFDERLLGLLDNPKFADHFHLSLQSGSTSVLRRMERNYTADFFLELTKKIRSVSPDCGISTDIIAGFPDESEGEFHETLDLVRRAEFTRAHVFPYSPRSHTKSEKMKDLPQETKKERVRILEETSLETAADFVRRNVLGKKVNVLAETPENGKGTGYTSNYIKVIADGDMKENEFYTLNAVSTGSEKSAIIIKCSTSID